MKDSIPEEVDLDSDVDEGDECHDDTADVLDMSLDISALVVHEQKVDVRCGSGEAFVASRILLSVDLWLHIWSPVDMAPESNPTESIQVATSCLRPVVELEKDSDCILELRFRPLSRPEGLVETLGTAAASLIWGPSTQHAPLWIRCADARAADELMGVLEIVEKLYPLVDL